MGSPRWRDYETRDALDEALSRDIGRALLAGIRARQHATLVVPGGTTPVPLFQRLAGLELPWNLVRITLTDERWVSTADTDSNERLIRCHLTQNRAAGANVVGLYQPGFAPEDAVSTCEQVLQQLDHPFDVVVLGVGDDGHIASLFPGMPDAALALDPRSDRRCIAVRPGPTVRPSGVPRLSLTLACLIDTKSLRVLIAGDRKRRLVVNTAAGAPETAGLPIAALLRQNTTPVEIFWCPDE